MMPQQICDGSGCVLCNKVFAPDRSPLTPDMASQLYCPNVRAIAAIDSSSGRTPTFTQPMSTKERDEAYARYQRRMLETSQALHEIQQQQQVGATDEGDSNMNGSLLSDGVEDEGESTMNDALLCQQADTTAGSHLQGSFDSADFDSDSDSVPPPLVTLQNEIPPMPTFDNMKQSSPERSNGSSSDSDSLSSSPSRFQTPQRRTQVFPTTVDAAKKRNGTLTMSTKTPDESDFSFLSGTSGDGSKSASLHDAPQAKAASAPLTLFVSQVDSPEAKVVSETLDLSKDDCELSSPEVQVVVPPCSWSAHFQEGSRVFKDKFFQYPVSPIDLSTPVNGSPMTSMVVDSSPPVQKGSASKNYCDVETPSVLATPERVSAECGMDVLKPSSESPFAMSVMSSMSSASHTPDSADRNLDMLVDKMNEPSKSLCKRVFSP